MHQFLLIFLLFCQGITFLTGMLYWSKIKNSIWKYFVIYLGFIFLSECLGKFSVYMQWNSFNIAYFHYIVIPLEFLFYFWFLAYLNKSINSKKVAIIFSSIYLLSLILENLFSAHNLFLVISYSIGNLFLLILIIKIVMELMNGESIINFYTNPIFYLIIGLLLFYLGTFPFYAFKNIWYSFPKIGNRYYFIATILNCIMYCMFTFSFLCKRHKS